MGTMEDEAHSEKERRTIIEKYDRGREEGAQIDDWEDPEFPLYGTTDHYGFIHDKAIPKEKKEEQRRILKNETERVEKWIKMGQKWEKYKKTDKFRQRVFKGIPDKVRGRFWSMLLELETLKVLQKGKYQEMLAIGREYSPDVRQIDLDVNRTYRDHINFRERFSTSQKSLFNILCAYSVYNSEVGYCQGMSQIAALLLMYLPEEDAFWGMAQLMTHHKYAMHGFFIHGFPKLVRFQAHHDKVLQKMLPRLKKHFDKHGVDSGLYTLKWFFQCFLDRVPFPLALRFWDVYFYEGERVLICGAFTILKIHSKQLLAKKNMDDIVGYIQSGIPSNFGMDFDRVIENYQEYTDELHRKRIDNAGPPGDNESATKPFGFNKPIPAPTTTERIVVSVSSDHPPVPTSIERNVVPNTTDRSVLPISTEQYTTTSIEEITIPTSVDENSVPNDAELKSLSISAERNPISISSDRNHSLRPSASSVGHHLMDSRIAATKIKVPPPVAPRNSSPMNRNHRPASPKTSSPPSSPQVSPHRVRRNPSVSPPLSPPRIGSTTSTPSSSGILTIRIHVPYAGTS